MSIASRITEMINHTSNTYNKLENLGEDFSNTDKNIENISNTLQNIYDNWPKIEENDVTTANLTKTKSALAKIDLKGNTDQFTTTGKNLFKPINSGERDGITFTNNGDGSYTINGTATQNTSFYITGLSYGAGTYTLSANNTQTNSNIIVQIETTNDGRKLFNLSNVNAYTSFTVNDIKAESIVINNGATVSNFIIKPQLEVGSTATSFEPYTNGASPNPDYPQEVEVVSGENKVKVVNKNLFDTELEQNARSNADGTTKIWSANYVRTIDKIKVKPNTTYRISFTLESSNGGDIQEYQKDGTYINNILLSQNGASFTTPENCYYINVQWYRSIGITPSDVTNIQLEEGSTATTYEEHKEQDFPISLHSRNLFNTMFEQNAWNFDAGISYVSPNYIRFKDKVEVKPGQTYTLSFNYNETLNNGCGFVFYNDGIFISSQQTSLLTFTVPNNANQVIYDLYNSSGIVPSDVSNIQLEEGSTATTYQPYYNYELCKIGDYQDYIYKNNDNWYIKKKIGKSVLNGSENWDIAERTNKIAYITSIDSALKSTTWIAYCNYYLGSTNKGDLANASNNGNNTCCFMSIPTSGNRFYIVDNTLTTVSAFKTWLSTHNVIVYYVLATEQDILITDSILINQLNNLYNAKSYDNVTNIIQENNDLPFILDITTLNKALN